MRLRTSLLAGICSAAIISLAAATFAQTSPEKPVDVLPTPAVGGAVRNVPVSVNLKTNKKKYAPNEIVKITMTVKNTQKSAVKLTFGSGQHYDIEIRRGKKTDGEKVWQWSNGKMFTMMVSSVTFAPGKAETYTITFDPQDKQERKPINWTPGTYTITGTLTTMGRTPRPFDSAVITVK